MNHIFSSAWRIAVHSSLGLVLILAGFGADAAQPAAAAPRPVLPLNTNFWSYWTHYWATWLPDHPVYEMIELTAYENPKDPADRLVRVFLTERAGRKRQYFYLDSEEEVKRSRANAIYRDITYRRSGSPNGVQNLHVEFLDKDSLPVVWSIRFDDKATLRQHGDGLTPSIHSLGSLMLFALRTKTVDTHDETVLFNGVDYASKLPATDLTPATRRWFNPDYYSAIMLYGKLDFRHEDGGLSNSWGRTFKPTAENPLRFRSSELGPENHIEFDMDPSGGLKAYAHHSRGHTLDFTLQPALPPLATVRSGVHSRFRVAFDKGRTLMTGDVRVANQAEGAVTLEWVPDSPTWAVGRNFRSILRFTDGGYQLQLADGLSPTPVARSDP